MSTQHSVTKQPPVGAAGSSRRKGAALGAAAWLSAACLVGTSSVQVMAGWQESIYANAPFQAVTPPPLGYARGVASNLYADFVGATDPDWVGASVIRDQTNTTTGTASEPALHADESTAGVRTVIDANAQSCASYFSGDATSCRTEYTVNDASASATLNSFRVQFASSLIAPLVTRMELTAPLSTSVICPIYTSQPPAAGGITPGVQLRTVHGLGNTTTNYNILTSTGTTTISGQGSSGFNLNGNITTTNSATTTSAVSRVHLYVRGRSGLIAVWEMWVNFVNADCGIGTAPPPLPLEDISMVMHDEELALLLLDEEGNPREEGLEAMEDGRLTEEEREALRESVAPEGGAVSDVPLGMRTVTLDTDFTVLSTEGDKLARARIAEAVWDSPTQVALRLNVSDVEKEMAAPTGADLHSSTQNGWVKGAAVANAEGRNSFPAKLTPGESYDAWVTVDVADAAPQVMLWKPEGTHGWNFSLPEQPAATPTPGAAPTELPPAELPPTELPPATGSGPSTLGPTAVPPAAAPTAPPTTTPPTTTPPTATTTRPTVTLPPVTTPQQARPQAVPAPVAPAATYGARRRPRSCGRR